MTATAPILLVENSIGLSGSTISLCSLVARLDPGRFEPHVVVSRPDQEAYVRRRLKGRATVTLVQPYRGLKARLPRGARRVARRTAALADLVLVTLPYSRALARVGQSRRARLVHQNNGFEEGAILAARLMGVPVVAYQRGQEWNSPTVRRLARRVAHFLANSAATRETLLDLGVPPARITLAYPPVELADFDQRQDGPRGRAAYAVPEAAPCFGIVAQLIEWKGHRVFLEAARRVLQVLPEARAWIIGGAPAGQEAYERNLRGLAAAMGIESRVVFTGFIHDVPGVLRLLDVVVHASTLPEPFGRVIVEAMLMGKPVVAADAGGPREIVVPGRTGLLVPPGDPAALADGVLALLRDPEMAGRLGRAASQDARERFSADEHARLVQEVYGRILAAPDSCRSARRETPAPLRGDLRGL
jgi:glycosyltransferase involved in cell wall biosynthesis